jgi:hypothetical protein
MSANDPIEVSREVIPSETGVRVWEVTNVDTGQVVGYDLQAIDEA